jgi:hypothetical protein
MGVSEAISVITCAGEAYGGADRLAARVGEAHHLETGDRLDDLAQDGHFRAGGVLGRELDVGTLRAGVLHRRDRQLQNLVFGLLQLVLHMDLRRGQEDMHAGPDRILDRIVRRVDVLFDGTRQPAYGRSFDVPRDRLHRLEVARTRHGKSRLDDIDAQHGELPGYLELLIDIEARARALLPVA